MLSDTSKTYIPCHFCNTEMSECVCSFDYEKADLWQMADRIKPMLDDLYHPDGYNIGINVGEPAGQSIFHVHLHLIPRYIGDTPNPKGGVRGVIPGKQGY